MSADMDRLAVFEDSREVAQALREMARSNGYPYGLMEAATHIEALWQYAQELHAQLRKDKGDGR